MKEKIIEIVAEFAMVDPDQINVEDRLLDLYLDSLDLSDMLVSVEDLTGVEIGLDEEIYTVADLIDFVNANI